MINPTGTQYPHEIQWIWIRIWISTYGYEYRYKFLFVAFLLTESNYSTQLKSDLLSSLHACRFDALAYVWVPEYRRLVLMMISRDDAKELCFGGFVWLQYYWAGEHGNMRFSPASLCWTVQISDSLPSYPHSFLSIANVASLPRFLCYYCDPVSMDDSVRAVTFTIPPFIWKSHRRVS
jgi:hypothetical protein